MLFSGLNVLKMFGIHTKIDEVFLFSRFLSGLLFRGRGGIENMVGGWFWGKE